MGKPARERTLPENEARAVTKLLRVSPQKLNLVAKKDSYPLPCIDDSLDCLG